MPKRTRPTGPATEGRRSGNTLSATEAARRFSDMLNRVVYNRESFLGTKRCAQTIEKILAKHPSIHVKACALIASVRHRLDETPVPDKSRRENLLRDLRKAEKWADAGPVRDTAATRCAAT